MAWAATGDAYTTPTVRLDVPSAPWLADAAVTSWTVERELVGSTLPGNIRARTGLSIGSGSVNVRPSGGRRTPWDVDPTRRVTTDAAARLYVDDGAGSTLDLGQWRTGALSGSLAGEEIPVGLVETQYAGKRLKQTMRPTAALYSSLSSPPDPIFIVDAMARQMGYAHVTWPRPATVLTQLPLTGSFEQRGGSMRPWLSGTCDSWGKATGTVGPDGATTLILESGTVEDVLIGGGTIGLWITVTGPSMGIICPERRYSIWLNSNSQSIQVSNNTSSGSTSNTWTGDAHRLYLEIQRTYPSGPTSTATQLRVRVNGGAWVTDTRAGVTGSNVAGERLVFIAGGATFTPGGTSSAGSAFTAIQIGTGAIVFAAPPVNADLSPLGGSVRWPYLEPDADPWTAIQTVCEKWQAAAYIDREAVSDVPRLVVLDRAALAGVGTTGTVTDIGAEWVDFPWALDPEDTADRLEVTYNPPAVSTSDGSANWWPQLWASDDVVTVPAGATTVIHATLTGTGAGFATPWLGAWLTPGGGTSVAGFNTYSIFDNADGTGTHLPESAVSLTTTVVSVSQIDIAITNLTAAPIYFVDANGEACLILRAFQIASFDTPSTLSRGADASIAENVLSVDLGPYVQSDVDAATIINYLWARCSTPLWKASSVQCRLDWRHEIGEVLRLTHDASELDAKALVVKVTYSGSAGSITQELDLVLLPLTWDDFDTAWSAQTWDDFDTAWSALAWDDFDNQPLAGA